MHDEENVEPGSPKYDLGCLIGDVSEGFYYCSYNDDDVFCAWKNRTLNAHWQRHMDITDKSRCGYMEDLWAKYYPEGMSTFDWEGLFDRIFEKAGAWPTGWLSAYETLEQLSTQRRYQYEKRS